jgi:hypothetical protein
VQVFGIGERAISWDRYRPLEAWKTLTSVLLRQRTPLRILQQRFGIDAPDGRPLHRYHLSDDGYVWLQQTLLANVVRLRHGFGSAPMFLALWASAWFRHHYTGGTRNYDDLRAALGLDINDAQWRNLLEKGLKGWKRTPIVRKGRSLWLTTVAVEGGFPVQVLSAGGGVLPRYLSGIVARLLGYGLDPSFDEALAIADATSEMLRDTFREEAFIALSADLALSIVKLRRLAEAALPGVQTSIALDQIRPKWRDELPIATDNDASRSLVDGMLTIEKMSNRLSGAAGCTRMLKRRTKGWTAGLRLSLTGELHANALAGLAASGMRLSVHPYGALTQVLSEELAFLDPPGLDGTTWRLRPQSDKSDVENVPFEAKIEVLIQAPSGAARVIAWPGGKPEYGDVMTFDIDDEDEQGPKVLLLTARGSASLKAKRVVISVPADWLLNWENSSDVGIPATLGLTTDGRRLWLIDNSVLIQGDEPDCVYSIRVGVDEDHRDSIELKGFSPLDYDGMDDMPLFSGAPEIHCYRGIKVSKPSDRELFWRMDKGDAWREFARYPLPSVGVIDIIWRDPRSRFLRDHARFAVIPQPARVRRDREGNGWCYTFQGFGKIKISADPADGLIEERRSNNTFVLSFAKSPKRRVFFVLCMTESTRKIRIALPFPLNDGIARWNGEIVPPIGEITPSELAELVAYGENRIELCSELKHVQTDYPTHYTRGERELSLRPLADKIRSDLAAAGIDARVELTIGNNHQPWRIKLFDSEVDCSNGVAIITKVGVLGETSLILAGRSVAAPCEEHCLAQISREDAESGHPISFPTELECAWWVYLRSGPTVRSRPTIVSFPCTSAPKLYGLAQAMVIVPTRERQAAIAERLAVIASILNDPTAEIDPINTDIEWLRMLITSLDGIPASTFDVFSFLPQIPEILAYLLLSSHDIVRSTIWQLETELHFMWAALPLRVWQVAARSLGQRMVADLMKADWELTRAAPQAKKIVDDNIARVTKLAPSMNTIFVAANLIGSSAEFDVAQSIVQAAHGYIHRTSSRSEWASGRPKQTSLFREYQVEVKPHLPTWFEKKFDRIYLEALDAPIAVAMAAKNGIQLTPAQLRRCKEAALFDPVYFEEGIRATLIGTEG